MVLLTTSSLLKSSVPELCRYRQEKFGETGAWCKEQDWVIFGRYAGSRFKIEGGEVRILNDDEILATVKDPEDIVHQF